MVIENESPGRGGPPQSAFSASQSDAMDVFIQLRRNDDGERGDWYVRSLHHWHHTI